jgi:hypothetical protein
MNTYREIGKTFVLVRLYDVNIDECKQVIKYLSWYSLRAKLPILWKWTKLKINKKMLHFC